MQVKIKRLTPEAKIPTYCTSGSSGADIYAVCDKDEVLYPGQHKLISTGIAIEIPTGYEVQIRPRSGLAAKNGITVLNTPGTIDSDYRGEIKVCLINHSSDSFTITSGMRIAQMVVAPTIQADFMENTDLEETQRGNGGFGSTGVQ